MMSATLVKPSSSGQTTIEITRGRNLFEEMEALTKQIAQRAFNMFQARGGSDGHDLDDWFHAESEVLKSVPIELSESPDSYTIRAEVPGFEVKDLQVQVEPATIYIHGKSEQKKQEKKGKEIRYSEVSAHELARRINLPALINPERATASLANGVLELTLPKAVPAKKIEVKAA